VEDKGYVQQWHLRYKTSDISETKRSRAKISTECLWCTAYRLVTNLVTYCRVNFGLLFQGATFFHNGYLAHFFSERNEIWQCYC